MVNVADIAAADLWVHDETDRVKAGILARFFDDPSKEGALPRPFGIFYVEKRATYESEMIEQVNKTKVAKVAKLDDLLRGSNTWEIK